jgi:hypothetical protein
MRSPDLGRSTRWKESPQVAADGPAGPTLERVEPDSEWTRGQP